MLPLGHGLGRVQGEVEDNSALGVTLGLENATQGAEPDHIIRVTANLNIEVVNENITVYC